MLQEEFIQKASKMGYAPKSVCEKYAHEDRVYTDEDYVAVYRMANPEYIDKAPDCSLAADGQDMQAPEKMKNVNRAFVESAWIKVNSWYASDRKPTYIRDEKMRLVLNPERLVRVK